MTNPTPSAKIRVTAELFPDVGTSADITVDTAVIQPIVLLGGSGSASTWNANRCETRRIAASDTNVAFTMPGDAVAVAVVGTGNFKFRIKTGEQQITTSFIAFSTNGDDTLTTGDVEFLIDGNGTDAVNVTVFLLSQT